MKNVIKLLAIIALVAVIGFSFIACSDGGGENGTGTPDLTGDITISPNSGVQTETELTANYSGSEAVTYQWKKDGVNVGENSNMYTPTEAGTYTVTVSAAGYKPKTSAAVDVGDPSLPALPGNITITPNSSVQTNMELTATYSGSETVTYQWKKDVTATVGTNTNKYTPTTAGSYTVTVSAAGYKPKTSEAVDVGDPNLPALTGNITITPNSGVQTNTELTATYSGSETVTYQWKKDGVNVGENSNKYTPTTAGSYTVTVSAAGYNPKTSAAVAVTAPVAPTIITSSLPNGTVGTPYSQTITAPGDTPIAWSIESGTLPTGLNLSENTIAGTPTAANTFNFTVKATNAAGYDTQALSITIASAILTGNIAITPNSGVQTNTELTANYSGSEAVSYQWKKDGANVGTASTIKPNKYTPTTAGSYTVTVSLEGYNPKTSDPVTVNDASLSILTGNIAITPNSGVQTNTELTADYSGSEAVSYQWKKDGANVGTNTNKYTPTTAGSYTVTVSAAGYNPKTSAAVTVISATKLTLNTWADGDLPANDEQWFTFTATASTQYIHVSFGTLTNLYVQVYNSSGATVGDRTTLSSTNKYISRSVSTGQTYYIKVTPYSSSYSGTYKIAFNTGFVPPGVIPLTLNTWADGDLPANGEQWFTFTATASTQYIHASFGALPSLYVQVYNSSGATVGDRTYLGSSSTNKYISRTVSTGQTYYIKVTPYSSSGSGTYKIAFNTGFVLPDVTLTLNTWENGDLPANGEQWFSFTATANTQYIHASFGALTNLYVQVYSSSGATVGTQTNLYDTYKYISPTVSTGQTYYIKVTPYGSGSGGISGTYQIAFNTGIVPPGVTPTELTLNTWADGNLPANGEQWFTFTATASTQYIHASFGTLKQMYVQVYSSSGATVGNRTYLGSSTRYISRTVSTGQTYYIKVMPYSSSYSGTYKIGFSMSSQPTFNDVTLTLNTWENGDLPANGEQWFTFTATASTQYIHVSFGTSSILNVQVYDSNGATVGDETNLNSSSTNKYISRTVSTGQTYYIKVTTYLSSGTYQIGFNTGGIPPGVTFTALTLNTWENSSLPSGGEQWFTFTATASTQYILASFGTLTNLYVQVYNSSGATVGDRTNLSSSSANKYISRTVSTGQTYYIKVTPYGSGSGGISGTYQIVFSTGFVLPDVTLTLNTWADGNLPANGEQWFSFTATASPQYIHASFGTLPELLYLQVYDSSGNKVGFESTLRTTTASKYISLTTLSTGQAYYIKVWSYTNFSGTYKILFNTSTVFPITLPTENVTALTLNQWENGSLPAKGEQWFTFTATAGTQYIHVSFGTLTDLLVYVYDSSGGIVGGTNLFGSTKYISHTVSMGQTYYIKVTPFSGSGTYKIGFNTSTTVPVN